MGLEHILHDRHTLGAVKVGGLAHHHVQLFVSDVVEARAAVNGGGSAGGAFQLCHLHALTQGVHDVLGGQLRTQDVIGSDLAVDVHAVDGPVHGDDLHAFGDGSLDSAGDAVRVHGVDDQHADVGRDQVLDVADLLGHVVTGVGDAQGDAQLIRGGLGALHQGDEEGVVLGGDGQADAAVGRGIGGCGSGLAVDDNGAACCREGQSQA